MLPALCSCSSAVLIADCMLCTGAGFSRRDLMHTAIGLLVAGLDSQALTTSFTLCAYSDLQLLLALLASCRLCIQRRQGACPEERDLMHTAIGPLVAGLDSQALTASFTLCACSASGWHRILLFPQNVCSLPAAAKCMRCKASACTQPLGSSWPASTPRR